MFRYPSIGVKVSDVGSKNSRLTFVVNVGPLNPPAIKTFPLSGPLDVKGVAVWNDRPRIIKPPPSGCLNPPPSKISADWSTPVLLNPPVISTRSPESSVALCCDRGTAIGPTSVDDPSAGSYSSAEAL